MNKIIANANLNINSWLLSCGLMYGHLHNGIIHSTKFTILKWQIAVGISIFTIIKWGILFLC